jgi:hypothetical protein
VFLGRASRGCLRSEVGNGGEEEQGGKADGAARW